MKKVVTILYVVCLVFSSNAQVTNTATLDTSGGTHIKNITIGAYADIYYGYNFNETPGNNIPYLVSMNRHNEMNINLTYLDFRYQSEMVRARIVPGFGTYMNANYATEPATLRNLVEANAGIRLSRKKSIWLDLGILGSPYTNESAISKDHLMYTRSFAPEYVPYYLAGVKLTLPVNEKLNAYLLVMNGWQQIQDQNNGKSIGTQVEYRPNASHLINWNTYVGDERSAASPANRMRYFSDIYWLYNAGKRWSFTSCIYAGMQEQKDAMQQRNSYFWWQANFIAAYQLKPKLALAGRVEYFSDPNRIQINAVDPSNGFEGGSAGLCLNFRPADNMLIRLEGRHFRAQSNQFLTVSGVPSNTMTMVCGNVTVWF